MQRFSKKNLLAMADIDTRKVSRLSFPFPEYLKQVGYSCGIYGCTGRLMRGYTSGAMYFVDPYGNDTPPYGFIQSLASREMDIVERLDHIERDDSTDGTRETFSFVARDGSRFTVTSADGGHTWAICG